MSNTPRTAYLHIGAHKTGTTAIQSVLQTAAPALLDQGFHYLSSAENHSTRLALAFWNRVDAERLAQQYAPTNRPFEQSELRESLRQDIAAHPAAHLVISAEELCLFYPKERAAFLDFLDPFFARIKVIAYARDPQDWMHSFSQQRVKWYGDTPERLRARPQLPHFRESLAPWRAAVGAANFDLRAYGGADFDAVADLAQALDLALPEALQGQTLRKNASLSQTGAMLLALSNHAYPAFVDHRLNPCRPFKLVENCQLPGPKFQLPREALLPHLDALEEDRAWINDRLGAQILTPPPLPDVTTETWMGPDPAATKILAQRLAQTTRSAQNDEALKLFVQAQNAPADPPEPRQNLLTRAARLSTDRWTLSQIAEMAAALQHPGRAVIFAKQKQMNRIEAPGPDDPPLRLGNPFDRYQPNPTQAPEHAPPSPTLCPA